MIIEMFPAESGDAFLIRVNNKNILIDMGYSNTYKVYIKNRLIELKNQNQCIDLLVITHIDEDHIQGVIEFLKENGNVYNPNIIEIKEIWHNSYRHLQFDKEKVSNISDLEKMQLKDIKLSNEKVRKKETCESNSISALQGSTLAGYLYALGYAESRWNKSFNFKSVNLDNYNEIQLGNIKIHMLSPNTNKLKVLSKLWIDKLRKIDWDFCISDEEIFDDAYEMYLKKLKPFNQINEDNNISYNNSLENFETKINETITSSGRDLSKSNGASIAFILEYENKKILFLGDSHEDIIIDELNNYKESGKRLEFDAIKLSHHGSIKNNFKLIENIKCNRYLISTDGTKHRHPNQEIIAKILKCNKDKKTIYFNYPLEICSTINKHILKEKYNYSLVVGDGNSSLIIEV